MIKRINHITFSVSDLKKSMTFYEKILGLKKTGEWSNYAIFDVGGMDLALAPGGKKGRKEGTPDIYMSVNDVDEAYKNLKEKGVKFVRAKKPILGWSNGCISRSRRQHVHSCITQEITLTS